jgi:hypothetical protein
MLLELADSLGESLSARLRHCIVERLKAIVAEAPATRTNAR